MPECDWAAIKNDLQGTCAPTQETNHSHALCASTGLLKEQSHSHMPGTQEKTIRMHRVSTDSSKEQSQTTCAPARTSHSHAVCEYRTALNTLTPQRTHTGDKPFACTVCEYGQLKEQSHKPHAHPHRRQTIRMHRV